MRLLIDLQCAQHDRQSWSAGAHLLNLVEAMLPIAERDGHDIHLLLNNAFPATIPPVQRRFPKLHAQYRIHVFQGLEASDPTNSNRLWHIEASRLLRDFAIAGLSPDAVMSPSLFHDGTNNASHPRRLALSDTPNLAIHHDLVRTGTEADEPSKNPSDDHEQPFDAVIAVSETTRQDAMDALNCTKAHTRTIPGDAGAEFTPPDSMSLLDMEHLRARYALLRPYLLAVGSKSCPSALQDIVSAYNALPRGIIDSHDLVIAGNFSGNEISCIREHVKTLSLNPGHVRILDHVSDEDLPGIFGLAEIFVMPAARRGFGLPALQAIRSGTLAIGANAASLSDVVGTPETLFEPGDIRSLTSLILRGLTDAAFRARMQDKQTRSAAHFSWEASARKALSSLADHTRMTSPESEWSHVQNRLDKLEDRAIGALKALPEPDGGLSEQDRNDLARALLKTRLATENAWRPRSVPQTGLTWRLEGPFDSHYSLASVNRETARALNKQGVKVALVSAEGDGPFDPDPDFLTAHPDLDALHATGQQSTAETVDILSRNLFPPRVSDMRGPLNLLHGYAWEETGLPQDYTRDMTAHLQGLLVTSPHVKKLFEDAGIGLPIHVVGNGVDHLDVPPEPLPITLPQAGFTCLHVSSCFPRKGPDVLLKSFAQAFEAGDDVQLVIKTFSNPHNEIGAQVSALQVTYPNLPPITVVEEPLTPGQMRSLYAAADLLIAPSRAEGYCLPVAEAVLAGKPVLTTGWGGQKIFAGNPLVHFVDYAFAPAQSHLVHWDSVWAEPDQTDLANKLKAFRLAPKPSQETSTKASHQILTDHTWEKVAERSRDAVQRIAAHVPDLPPKVGWVSSYNTRCGIATYSAHLIEAFPDEITVFASHTTDRITSDNAHVRRCWKQNGQDTLAQLQAQIRATNPQILVIQFNSGFFSFPHLGALILQAKADGRQVVMMMHATDDSAVPPDRQLARIRPALEACDQLLVHSHHDLNHLKSIGLEDNVSLFPHGVPYAAVPAPPKMSPDRPVVLGTYGFFLPPKGLDQLIAAVAHVRNQGENVALDMINAEFPIKDSAEAIQAARQQIRELGLDGHVNLETRFLDDADSFSRLAQADALVFSYQKTAESASGAIRQALALDRPVLATPLRIFDDVEPLIMRLPGTSAEDIAQGILRLIRALRNPEAEPQTTVQLDTMRSNANRWRESHAYQVLGPRLWRQICALGQ